MIKNKNARKGFTLIEILVVVAIIAILASVVLIGLGPAQKAGRDARRISDLRQIQNGVELYFSHCGSYPFGSGGSVPAGCGPAGNYDAMAALLQAGSFAANVPHDPNPNKSYAYTPNFDGSGYTLSAVLDDPGNPAIGPPSNPNGVSCGGNTATYCVSL